MISGMMQESDRFSFNRYMVECECVTASIRLLTIQRFNRYMVECEFLTVYLYQLLNLVLIDTWWNVNVSVSIYLPLCSCVLIDTWWNVNVCCSFLTLRFLPF